MVRTSSFLVTILLLCLWSHRGHTQPEENIKKDKDVLQKRILDTLKEKLSGVKYAVLSLTQDQENFFIENAESIEAEILNGVTSYIKDDLGIEVLITRKQRQEIKNMRNPSFCDYALVGYGVEDVKSSSIVDGKFSFKFSVKFCDESRYSFEAELSFNELTNYVDLVRGA